MRARVAVSAGLTALVAMALAGCNFVTPQATLVPYEPGDGLSTQVGDIDVLNAFVISDDGESGNLVFTAVNHTDDDVDLTVQFESGGERIDVVVEIASSGTTDVGFGENGQLFLDGIDVAPGSLMPVYFQYDDVQGRQLLLPVLDGGLEQYAALVPTPTPMPIETGAASTPSPEPTP